MEKNRGGEKIEIFQEKKAKAKNMTRDYFVQKSTKIGDMRRRENAKNEAHCGKIPIFVQKIKFSIIPFLAGKFKFQLIKIEFLDKN